MNQAIADGIRAIGEELARDASGILTAQERADAAQWVEKMAAAALAGEKDKVNNYLVAANGILGAAIFRTAEESRKAPMKYANLALSVLANVVIAAL